MSAKRCRVVEISPELLLAIVQDGTRLVQGDGTIIGVATEPSVPQDATLHHAYYDTQAGTFCAVIEHEDFSPVPEGESFPHVLATCTVMADADGGGL